MKNKPEVMEYINDLSKSDLLEQWNAYCYQNSYDNEIRELNYVLSLYADKIMYIKRYDDALEFLKNFLKDMKSYDPDNDMTCYMVGDACDTVLGFRPLGNFDDVFDYMRSDMGFLDYMNDMMIYDDDWLTENGYDLEGDDYVEDDE